MANTITVTVNLPPDSQDRLQKLATLETELPQAIKRGMDRALSAVRGRIQEQGLSGKGPFPVEQHRLGERSGTLRASLREEPAVIAGSTVTGSIGLHEFYGRVHEFGMLIFGRPLMHFQIDGKWVSAKAVIIPNRAVVRFGVQQNIPTITDEITTEVKSMVADL